jgi:hypothetical protein
VTVAARQADSDSGRVKYYTTEQLAALLQVNKSTITRLAARDASMPVLRISGIGGRRGVLRFPIDGIERWLAGKTVGLK